MSEILATILSIDIDINIIEFASNKNTGKYLLQIDGYIFFIKFAVCYGSFLRNLS